LPPWIPTAEHSANLFAALRINPELFEGLIL
jgi:hypothetical protein